MDALHVLIATDGSEGSQHALEFALRLLQPSGVKRLTIVSVVQPVSTTALALAAGAPLSVGFDWASVDDAQRSAANAAVQAAQTRLASLEAPMDGLIATGSPASQIVHVAEERDVDLIIIGSRGWGGAKSLLLGSVSGNVMHSAKCPVLVVRAGD